MGMAMSALTQRWSAYRDGNAGSFDCDTAVDKNAEFAALRGVQLGTRKCLLPKESGPGGDGWKTVPAKGEGSKLSMAMLELHVTMKALGWGGIMR
jgi:hypothetical protein